MIPQGFVTSFLTKLIAVVLIGTFLLPCSAYCDISSDSTLALIRASEKAGDGAKKIRRIKNLLRSLNAELEERDLRMDLELRGIGHAFKTEEESPAFDADFVTLELPNVVVSDYFQKGPKHVNVWNLFWRGMLWRLKKRKYSEENVYGINNSWMRHPIRRHMFQSGAKTIRGAKYVMLEEGREYDLREFGSRKKDAIASEQLLRALPAHIKAEFLRKKVVHVKPDDNPFSKKHLVLFKPRHESITRLCEELERIFFDEFSDLEVDQREISFCIESFITTHILSVYIDQKKAEELLERAKKFVGKNDSSAEPDREGRLWLVNVGGVYHNSLLRQYVTLEEAGRLDVKESFDSRFAIPESAKQPVHPKFLDSMGGILGHIDFSDDEAKVDVDYFVNLAQSAIRDDREFFAKMILKVSIQDEAGIAKGATQ